MRFTTLVPILFAVAFSVSCKGSLKTKVSSSKPVDGSGDKAPDAGGTNGPAIPPVPGNLVPQVELLNPPPAEADLVALAVTVGGAGLTGYRYALVAGSACAGATLGDWRDLAQPITDTPPAPGPFVLCVQGKTADGQVTEVAEHAFFVLGWIDAAVTATTRSETEVELQWTKPDADVLRYDLYVASDRTTKPESLTPVKSIADQATLSEHLTGLTPGTAGTVLIRARTKTAQAVTGTGAPFYTPFGTLNVTGVNQTPWNVGATGASASNFYAEALAVSARWSMIWAGFYWPQLGTVYAGLPTQSLQQPSYNFLSQAIRPTPHWFDGAMEDISQIWTDGLSKAAIVLSDHRVLLYNHLPTTPDLRDPDLILGQADFVSKAANRGGAASDATLSGPSGVCFNGTTLYVSDSGNNRILGWNGWPTTMGQAADFVLGQSGFTQTSARHGQAGADLTTLDAPGNIACLGGKLVVPEPSNHRVLIWSTAPTTSGVAASLVIGQTTTSGDGPNITGSHSNPYGVSGTPSDQGLFNPNSAVMVPKAGGGYVLIVGDMYNSRILQWDTFPTATGAAATTVYGQADFVSNVYPNPPAPTADTVQCPWFLANELDLDGQPTSYFWVADACGNNRHLRWPVNQPAAVLAVDQKDLTDGASYAAYSDNLHHRSSWWTVGTSRVRASVDPAGGYVAMADLAWNTLPASGSVDGQAGYGLGLLRAGGRFYWISGNTIRSQPAPTADVPATAAPDITIGHASPSDGHTPDATGYDDLAHNITPAALVVNGSRLYALDGPRIVIWNSLPTTDHPAIDAVIGQSAVTARTPNSGGVSASSLGDNAASMQILGGKLYVTDTANNRVLVWNTVPTASTPADLVLGQTTFTANGAGTDLAHMSAPSGVTLFHGKLLVADSANGRLLIWDHVPTASGTPADHEFVLRNEHYTLPAWFNWEYLRPYDLGVAGDRLVVALQDRALVLPDLWP